MLDTSVISDDSTIEVEGPQTVLERIESVVAQVSEGKTIERPRFSPPSWPLWTPTATQWTRPFAAFSIKTETRSSR